jgi:hypothetical protein
MLMYADMTLCSLVTEVMARKFETLTGVTHLLITKYLLNLQE